MWFYLLVIWFASACFCGVLADQKGYSVFNWCLAGFLFRFFALIAVAGLHDRKLRRYLRLIGEKQKAIEPENDDKNTSIKKQKGEVIINGVKQDN